MQEFDKRVQPLEGAYKQKFADRTDQIDRNYQREKARQEAVGETLSRITPTASLIYLTTNLTRTGKVKKHNYFEAADRYYGALHADLFSKIVDHASVRSYHPDDLDTIAQPPPIAVPSLDETLRHSLVDVLFLCFFAVVLTTAAFLKFFRSDI